MGGCKAGRGFYELVVNRADGNRILIVYGEAWDCLENPKIIASVTHLVVKYVSLERILEKLGSHVGAMSKIRKISVGDNAIKTLVQVRIFAELILKAASNDGCYRIAELCIQDN